MKPFKVLKQLNSLAATRWPLVACCIIAMFASAKAAPPTRTSQRELEYPHVLVLQVTVTEVDQNRLTIRIPGSRHPHPLQLNTINAVYQDPDGHLVDPFQFHVGDHIIAIVNANQTIGGRGMIDPKTNHTGFRPIMAIVVAKPSSTWPEPQPSYQP